MQFDFNEKYDGRIQIANPYKPHILAPYNKQPKATTKLRGGDYKLRRNPLRVSSWPWTQYCSGASTLSEA